MKGTLIKFRKTFIWSLILIIFLILLIGRYDWVPAFDSSLLSYTCSAFFLILTIPIFYHILHYFFQSQRIITFLSLSLGIIFSLPYRWLGLDRFSINNYWSIPLSSVQTRYEWFPDAIKILPSIPHEELLFISMAILGSLIAVLLHIKSSYSSKIIWFGLLFYFGILFQTWLHLSLRSPYTYGGSLTGNNDWPVYFLFPNEKGAVNADFHVHHAIELFFMGKPANLLLINRGYYYYLTSQASYFIHPYYVALIFNIGIWFTATICGLNFTKQIWNENLGIIVAGLIASGTGFIYYVAQPMSYLAAYALYIILIFLFQTLIIANSINFKSIIVFGVILGLSLLVNPVLFPIIILIIGFGYFRKVKILKLFGIVAIGLLIYYGFIFLITHGFHQPLNPDNYLLPELHISSRVELLKNQDFNYVYLLFSQFALLFWGGLSNAFFVFPLYLGVLGLTRLRNREDTILIMLFLAIPFAWTFGFHFGNVTYDNWLSYSTMPRYLFTGYPAIYILTALILQRMNQERIKIKNYTFAFGKIISAILLISIFILNNFDVLGFQSPYHLFYFLSPSLNIEAIQPY